MGKRFLIIVIILAFLGGGVLLYMALTNKTTPAGESPGETEATVTPKEDPAITTFRDNAVSDYRLEKEEAIRSDADLDGLTDGEENELGTRADLYDTDGDGLSDYEEVKQYGTDPLQADSDGDGYLDGQEVYGNFNPLGKGKLNQ